MLVQTENEKVWIKFPASTMVSKSALRNCQDRSFAEFNMMIHERKIVKFIFCVHNYACICQRSDVFKSFMTVADSSKINCERKHVCLHLKTREITPGDWQKGNKYVSFRLHSLANQMRYYTDFRSPPFTHGNIRQHLRMRISLFAVIDAFSANEKFKIETNVWGRWGRWIVVRKVKWIGRKTAEGKQSTAEGEKSLRRGKKVLRRGKKIWGERAEYRRMLKKEKKTCL